MSYWKEWGAYLATCVESGTEFGSSDLGWERIESDFLLPANRWYGGGLGLIQITSKNIEMLQAMHTAGVDFSSLPPGQLKDDVINKTQSRNYHIGSITAPGGCFTLSETQALNPILNTDQAKRVQAQVTVDYFTVDNGWALNLLEQANCPDPVKAFWVPMVVLAPASIRGLVNPPIAQTLDQAAIDASYYVGSFYAGRFNTLKTLMAQADINQPPPVNLFDLDPTTTGSRPVKPTTPDGENGGGDSGNETTDVPVPTPEDNGVKKPVPKWTLEAKPLYIKGTLIRQLDSGFKVGLDKNFAYLNYLSRDGSLPPPEANGNEPPSSTNPPDTGETSQQPSPGPSGEPDPTDVDRMIESWLQPLEAIPDATIRYQMARPQGDPTASGWADCSGFIMWGLRKIHPSVWAGGYTNTGTMYAAFKKGGYVTWEGNITQLTSQPLKRGDVIIMSAMSDYGAGGNSHTGVMTDGVTFYNQHVHPGNSHQNLASIIPYYLDHVYACIVKPVK